MRRSWAFLTALVSSASCATQPAPAPAPAPTPAPAAAAPAPKPVDPRVALRTTFDSLLDAAAFRSAQWGVLVVDATTGDTLYSRNAAKLFTPASNMKLVTGSVALTQLGPDHRFRTTLAARGPVRGGTLGGDLLVIGRGDPTVSDHMRTDAMTVMHDLADSLAAHGVKTIRGRLVAAGDAFPGATLGLGWEWDDLDASYGAATDELLFNEGYSEIRLRGGAKPGARVEVETRPARTFPRVRVQATTVAPAAPGATDTAHATSVTARKDTLTGVVTVVGHVVVGDTTTLEYTHHDPDAAYLAALREALADKGIRVLDRRSDTTAALDTLVRLESPPLRDVLPALMKPSQNQIAEMLFKGVALERTGVGSGDSARALVRRQLLEWGAAPDGFAVRDGSGMSRTDWVSPQTILRILDTMRRAPTFDVWYAALPIAGVDGTIKSRMKGTPAENNLHAKTGTLTGARSLSGYVTTADGRMLEFALLCNNYTVPTSEVTRAQDAMGVALASLRLR